MFSWEPDIQERREQAAAVLLGHLYTQAAVKKASEDQGQGFIVGRGDVEMQLGLSQGCHPSRAEEYRASDAAKRGMFNTIFNSVEPESLAQSESLQGFARSFGYSLTVNSLTVNSHPYQYKSLNVHFRGAV